MIKQDLGQTFSVVPGLEIHDGKINDVLPFQSPPKLTVSDLGLLIECLPKRIVRRAKRGIGLLGWWL